MVNEMGIEKPNYETEIEKSGIVPFLIIIHLVTSITIYFIYCTIPVFFLT
jgi:hypothetical protein